MSDVRNLESDIVADTTVRIWLDYQGKLFRCILSKEEAIEFADKIYAAVNESEKY